MKHCHWRRHNTNTSTIVIIWWKIGIIKWNTKLVHVMSLSNIKNPFHSWSYVVFFFFFLICVINSKLSLRSCNAFPRLGVLFIFYLIIIITKVGLKIWYIGNFYGDQRLMVYCLSDVVCICLLCNRNVHSTNTITQRHWRKLLCKTCSSLPNLVRCS